MDGPCLPVRDGCEEYLVDEEGHDNMDHSAMPVMKMD